MKKVILSFVIVVSLLLMSSLVIAEKTYQHTLEVEEYQFNNAETDFSALGDVKANGGPLIGLIKLNMGNLNDLMQGAGFDPFDEKMIVFGGSGVGGLKIGPRLGGMGMGGKISTTGTGSKSATLEISYSGFMYEHGIFSTENTDISIGALMGGGYAELNIKHGSLVDFEDGVNNPNSTVYKKNFILLQPKINIHQQLSPFIGMSVDLGYLVTYNLGEPWKVNDQVVDGPMSNIAAPVVCVNFSFGL